MGNDGSKRKLIDEVDHVQKRARASLKRLSLRRLSSENKDKDVAFDITEEEFKKLKENARRVSFTPFYGFACSAP